MVHLARRIPSNSKGTNTMENLNIETLRTDVAISLGTAYGSQKAYAIGLNAVFATDWFNIEHNDKSETAKPVLTEKQALYAELRKVNHTNPSVIWSRIREYGRNARYGEESAEGEEGEESTEGNARHNKPAKLRNIDELLALYKFNARQSELADDIKQAQGFIINALNALGVDLSKVETK